MQEMMTAMDHGTMLELKRWNTPTICNGLVEYIAGGDMADCCNREETHDFMPQMGPMIGRAVTLRVEPSNAEHSQRVPNAWARYRDYVASVPGPKIVVVQDMDKPAVVGSFWGEVTSNTHRALGCVGTITDGAIRDLDEMTNAGFKALARRLCVSCAHAYPVAWGEPVEVFGTRVEPGRLIHADKHGFVVVPPEDEPGLLEAARFMDASECSTVIAAARSSSGESTEQLLENVAQAEQAFGNLAKEKFGRSGEFS